MIRRWHRLTFQDALWMLVLLFGAAQVFEFRCFASLDGPLHVLHAGIQRARFTGPWPPPLDVWYEARSMPLRIGDLLVMLAPTRDPAILHLLFAFLAQLFFTLGAWALARAYSTRVNALLLWCLPLSFGFLLVLGVFHFMIGAGVAMACAAAWVKQQRLGWRSIVLLVASIVFCAFTHRAAPLLFALLVLCHELAIALGERAMLRARWSAVPRWLRWSITVVGIVALSFAFPAILEWNSRPVPPPDTVHVPLIDLVGLRCMRLFSESGEHRVLQWASGLFTCCIVVAIAARRECGPRILPSDMPALAALVLILSTLLLRSPIALASYVPERAETIALLLIAVWIAVQPVKRWIAITGAVLIVTLQTHRLTSAETTMAALNGKLRQAEAAIAHLRPGTSVLSLSCEDNWLLGHVEADVAAHFTGTLITHTLHVPYRWKGRWTARMRAYVSGADTGLEWFAPHCAAGLQPDLAQVVIFGNGSATCNTLHSGIDITLGRWYRKSFENGYATVWDLR